MAGTTSARPERRRRLLPLLCAGLVLLGQALLGLASPAAACGCGGFVDPLGDEHDANVLEETAVLSLRDGVETIVMGLSLDAERVGSTLLMPTPSVPEVSAGQSGTLREIAAATAPREEIEYDYWGSLPFLAGSAGGSEGDGASGEATVHSQERIGNYEVAVLGGDAEGVRSWLEENGYALDEELSALIDPYAEDGWTFTAVRYAADAVLSGDVEPLRFDFETDELIYPLRFSQAAETDQRVHLFVLADEPVGLVDGPTSGQTVNRPWIGSPTAHGWHWSDQTLRELAGETSGSGTPGEERPTSHRIVTEFWLWGDPDTFTRDLVLTEEPETEPVIPTYTTTELVTVLGIPVGWVLVFAGLITTVSVLVAITAVRAAARARRAVAA